MFKFFEEKFVPVAARIGNQRHLVAVRDGFLALMPLTIVGSLAVLFNNLPIKFYQTFMDSIWKHETWTQWGGNMWNATFGMMSIFLAITIAYNLAKSYDKDPLGAGVISLAAYMTFGTFGEGGISGLTSGTGGIFIAIIIALISTEIFTRLLGNPRMLIKMPDSVPPAVSKSFAALFPAIITIGLFALVRTVISNTADMPDIISSFYATVQAPFQSLTNSWSAGVIIALVPVFFWFFGVHGANIIEPFMQTINIDSVAANMKAVSSGLEAPYIITKPFFDAFVNMGGSGTSLALIVAMFLVARKNKQYMTVGKLSAAPGLFNINEPLLFGLPIILNPVLFIPFIITPVVVMSIAYFSMKFGLVPKTTIAVPWTTPPILNGILATQSWRGGVLSIVNLVVAFFIYLPFVAMAGRVQKEELILEEEHEEQVKKD
ncbi:PTS sugar transporter subunit IIC [Kurthia sibirica]|uniref:Permease IIC component n=1 Tax=Kurthia sibirica TaxID=202750 RepID=A0A2U3AIS8_9BACL|nr:PTS sugar transporter subunit IIC [Kurthia sibirica]PWI24361.1 PTS lactose transporter subunit IIC [Kurthia sibirica]GEK33353.1 permease IIC component [Kurthia sibirica]